MWLYKKKTFAMWFNWRISTCGHNSGLSRWTPNLSQVPLKELRSFYRSTHRKWRLREEGSRGWNDEATSQGMPSNISGWSWRRKKVEPLSEIPLFQISAPQNWESKFLCYFKQTSFVIILYSSHGFFYKFLPIFLLHSFFHGFLIYLWIY